MKERDRERQRRDAVPFTLSPLSHTVEAAREVGREDRLVRV